MFDVCVQQGRGWRAGRVRGFLRSYAGKHAAVAKRPPFRYTGPPVAAAGAALLCVYQQLPPVYPPADWVAPPEAGFKGAASAGTRLVEEQPWRAVRSPFSPRGELGGSTPSGGGGRRSLTLSPLSRAGGSRGRLHVPHPQDGRGARRRAACAQNLPTGGHDCRRGLRNRTSRLPPPRESAAQLHQRHHRLHVPTVRTTSVS